MNIYADSSLFVSLYLQESHSVEAWRRVNQRHQIWLTPLHRVEWTHAVAQHVFRHAISVQDAASVYSGFEVDRKRALWVEVQLPAATFETAMLLAKKHVPQLGCRTLDTLHVASALELGADEFWSFDERQLKLARAAGLKTR